MGTELQVFRFERYPVRVVVDETGGPWWVAKDVCDVLDLTNPSVAIESLEEDERAKFNLGRQGEAWMVNEPGLYSMVLRSANRKPAGFGAGSCTMSFRLFESPAAMNSRVGGFLKTSRRPSGPSPTRWI